MLNNPLPMILAGSRAGLTSTNPTSSSTSSKQNRPPDLIAEVTQHVPEPRKRLVRAFGFHANKSRGRLSHADRCVLAADGRPPCAGRPHYMLV
jgi:hypothetical protein